ncbi:hypothetical protein BCR35DRAFT_299411 [Leucosporidium creatinivorum]|uniref:Uncharacterized protein n=1 Tax=Leucosporidium creatinivorum TaxID=106004 RepID=A0A1Y2G1R8_9BASI|nr:hypothetical protein BCR35DRAFT_299411 [Leucosporidium creatinivorum]
MHTIDYSADPLSDDGAKAEPWADDFLDEFPDSDSDSCDEDEQEKEEDVVMDVDDPAGNPSEPASPPLLPLEDRLVPSQSTLTRILSCLDQRLPSSEEGFGRAWLWRQGRLVCSSWKTWIETRAREQWLLEAKICKDGRMIHPGNETSKRRRPHRHSTLEGVRRPYPAGGGDCRTSSAPSVAGLPRFSQEYSNRKPGGPHGVVRPRDGSHGEIR